MTNEQKKALENVMNENANKQLSFSKVINSTLKALSTDALTANYAAAIIGEHNTEERKHFLQVLALHMPHYVLNGTDEVVICDFIKATESNLLSKTIKQFRLDVDTEIVNPEGCANYVEVERESNATEEVKLASGFVISVPSRDAEGNLIKVTNKEQLVPRKKAVWGYTKQVFTAIVNTIEFIENEK